MKSTAEVREVDVALVGYVEGAQGQRGVEGRSIEVSMEGVVVSTDRDGWCVGAAWSRVERQLGVRVWVEGGEGAKVRAQIVYESKRWCRCRLMDALKLLPCSLCPCVQEQMLRRGRWPVGR